MMDIQTLYRLTVQRESALKTVIRTRPTEAGEIENLRKMIREAYVKMLFQDPIYAASKDMEQNLWKTCFYRKIEEFRKRIRKHAAAASSAETKAMANKARNELHAVCGEFGQFIDEALGFYQDLMGRFELLQAQHEEHKQRGGAGRAGLALEHDCVRSIHRCLIFLGDLARYRELHSESTRKDWAAAEKWYYQAIDALPTSGNPHNQLAVLATYTEAECVAVYRYCRALLCDLPFPTAKENLALLFEKNRQAMPDPRARDGAEELEEEERVRQGLLAGTITGQQAGIARATMLKSLLQRFVRLHGMLFASRQQQLDGDAAMEGGSGRGVGGHGALDMDGPFPVADFLGMLRLAMTDLRQLLKMSAFGDGLLLHMVIICVFSVLTSMLNSADHEAALEDSPMQSLSLSLAFGVAAEIAACVRTQRQESEHTTAKPPGSRLLGPVVVFCDWLASRPSLWRLKPLGSSSVAGGPCLPEKEKEAAIREQFWAAVCRIATELQPQLAPFPPNLPEELVWAPHDGRVLKEQHDLRGFEPLHEVFGPALMTRPKAELGRLEIVSDDLAASWRTVRLVRFLRGVGVGAGTVVCAENPKHPGCWAFACNGRENVLASAAAQRAMPFAAAYAASGGLPSSAAAAAMAASLRGAGVGRRVGYEEDGEEVIVFKPSFGGSGVGGGAGMAPVAIDDYYHQRAHLNALHQQYQHQHQQHPRQPSLDDSSQLPKDVVESMLGGLLDCSDSGPHPPTANYPLGAVRPPHQGGPGFPTAQHPHPFPGARGQGTAAGGDGQQQQQHHSHDGMHQSLGAAAAGTMAGAGSNGKKDWRQPQPQPGMSAFHAAAGASASVAAAMRGLPRGGMRSSGGLGWNTAAAGPNGNFSLEKQQQQQQQRPLGATTPPPPGLGVVPSSTLAGIAAASSLFGAGGGGIDAQTEQPQQPPPPQQGYNPFGTGLLHGIGGGGAGAGAGGRPAAAGLASKNPFLAANGFGSFAPWGAGGEGGGNGQ